MARANREGNMFIYLLGASKYNFAMVNQQISARTVLDQMGREVTVPMQPQRVVSLVPSQTELLFDLGMESRVAGVTRYCLHPPRAREIAADIGGSKRVSLKKIAALEPDLIIGNKEENDRETIETLAAQYPVWMSDIYNFDDALAMIRGVADLMGVRGRGDTMADQVEKGWAQLADGAGQSVAYLIWKKPYMACGAGTFIHAVLERLNFRNCLADLARYPETSLEALAERQPDWVMLSTEPFPFGDAHVAEFRAALPNSRVLLVDGEMFSWYGSRLLQAPAYFQRLLAEMASEAAA